MRWLADRVQNLLRQVWQRITATRQDGTIAYTGIAAVSVSAPGRLPVYRQSRPSGAPVGYLNPGQYAPHFKATSDLKWLQVTLHNGDKGWLANDPTVISVTLSDPCKVVVCIDPGHGGSDTGAVGNGLVEKEINFDIAYWHLGTRLQRDARVDTVWFTRTGDEDVSLAYRADLANASGAKLFVSVHNNSHLNTSRGTETYYKCGSEASESVGAASKRAACLIHLRIRRQFEAYNNAGCPWFDRGVICRLLSKSDPRSYYYVLRNTTVPAVLVEYLFISNPGEAACLADHTFRDNLAQATYDGIVDALFSGQTDLPCNFRTDYGL